MYLKKYRTLRSFNRGLKPFLQKSVCHHTFRNIIFVICNRKISVIMKGIFFYFEIVMFVLGPQAEHLQNRLTVIYLIYICHWINLNSNNYTIYV